MNIYIVLYGPDAKILFIGKHKLHGAIASSIASFNEGYSHISQAMQKMAIETNELLNVYIWRR